ncbi:MAG: hypothetical protein WBZ48_10200 [Bacteroidota bacterium]
MNIRRDRIWHTVELVLCALILLGIVGLIRVTDQSILVKRQSFQILSNSVLPLGQPYVKDEMRISKLFDEDTLPRLVQYGLVKKYELTQGKTVLFVNGKLWKQRSIFFKHCLLTEILVHNKVSGYSAETQIVDDQSRKLVAKITSSYRFAFYD